MVYIGISAKFWEGDFKKMNNIKHNEAADGDPKRVIWRLF